MKRKANRDELEREFLTGCEHWGRKRQQTNRSECIWRERIIVIISCIQMSLMLIKDVCM